MEANHPSSPLEDSPPPAPEAPTRYTVSTTAKPTVRLFKPKAGDPAHGGAVRSGSIRVGALPKTERLLRTPASTSPVDPGWTRPAAAKPFVTRSYSGLRIRSTDAPPATPSEAAPES